MRKLTLLLASTLAAAGCAHNEPAKPTTTPVAAAPAPTPAPAAAPAPAPRPMVIAANIQRVVTTEKGIAVTEKIQFDLNKAEILSASDSLLDEVAQVLKENPHVLELEIEGHTSSDGKAEHNQKLSQERAEAVKAALEKRGVAAERLSAKGYGSSRPVADDATEEGREKNRRVDFTILKSASE
jgi:outer membrane protein OmpA-like peptidoglycan-associated protein